MDIETLNQANDLRAKIEKAKKFNGHLIQATCQSRLAKLTVQSDVHQSGDIFLSEEVTKPIVDVVKTLIDNWQNQLDKL